MYATYMEEDSRWSFSLNPVPGAVMISDGEHRRLIECAIGKTITKDSNGMPLVVDMLPPNGEQVKSARLLAYADPITGSDRYFAEAQRESIMGNTDAADTAKALGIARYDAIREEWPWPVT